MRACEHPLTDNASTVPSNDSPRREYPRRKLPAWDLEVPCFRTERNVVDVHLDIGR
ncbi:hypothetical protein DAD186_21280 [Dermabacter vaginalis]|uniref:Uncharacterized protein n=1 Tax=Dermabacter vaginalis TaxID=1630135 RepID=A0A1B0ZL72_9MICO|nr:hypothetical protein DAD186_21280 [Dermabacter vaginalis]